MSDFYSDKELSDLLKGFDHSGEDQFDEKDLFKEIDNINSGDSQDDFTDINSKTYR